MTRNAEGVPKDPGFQGGRRPGSALAHSFVTPCSTTRLENDEQLSTQYGRHSGHRRSGRG